MAEPCRLVRAFDEFNWWHIDNMDTEVLYTPNSDWQKYFEFEQVLFLRLCRWVSALCGLRLNPLTASQRKRISFHGTVPMRISVGHWECTMYRRESVLRYGGPWTTKLKLASPNNPIFISFHFLFSIFFILYKLFPEQMHESVGREPFPRKVR